jgi:hypothetical protein
LIAEQPEDPENDHRLGLWLDQTVSALFERNTSLELEFHQRLDEGASNLYEYFIQAGVAFRLLPWLTILPSYRYQRYPGEPTIAFEHRLLVNLTLSTEKGKWRPILRTLIEGRFPESRVASARLRLRPGIEYTLPLPTRRPPVAVVNEELFFVPGTNSFASRGAFTQNRLQGGIRLPISDSFSIRPYFMLQSVNRAHGWEHNEIIGVSLAYRH